MASTRRVQLVASQQLRLTRQKSSAYSLPLSSGRPKRFRILGLESSADDTCAAVVDSDRRLLSSVVRKQHDIHKVYGGIHPLAANNAHIQAMPGVIKQALQEASLTIRDIDAVAFTQGPGMFNPLMVSANSAAAIAAVNNLPLIGVNHMQGHALTPLMTELNPPSFPFLTLLISGGHTQLVFASSLTSFRILVDTGAIPIGNCFDKIASALKLEPDANFGLGAALERLAASTSSSGSPAVPEIPKLRPASLDGPVFELTGLVTRTFKFLSSVAPTRDKAAVHAFNPAKVSEGMKIAVVREAQRALTAALVDQTRKVVGDLRVAEEEGEKEGRGKLRELVVSGGVASNAFVRARLLELGEELGLRIVFPPVSLCTDNAAMIANAAIHRFTEGSFNDLSDCLPRRKWSIEDIPASPSGGEMDA